MTWRSPATGVDGRWNVEQESLDGLDALSVLRRLTRLECGTGDSRDWPTFLNGRLSRNEAEVVLKVVLVRCKRESRRFAGEWQSMMNPKCAKKAKNLVAELVECLNYVLERGK